MSSYSFDKSNPPGKFIQLGSYKIHYEIIGHGKEFLFLIPGGMGSGRTHFGPQLDDLDRDKLTVIAWDPPGYGYSGPPDHTVYVDGFHRDAKVAIQLLKALSISRCNVLGWCGGGMTACVLTALAPQLVSKLIVVSSWGQLDNHLIRRWNAFSKVSSWSPRMRDPLVSLYGINFVQNRWNVRLATFEKMQAKSLNGEVFKSELESIKCPTLLIHCQDDAWVPIQKAHYLQRTIPNTKLVEFEDGNHYPHLSHDHRFNRLVEQFIYDQ